MSKGRKKIGRNEPCPCGSGKKFKRCHGNLSKPSTVPLSPALPKTMLEQILREIDAKRRQREHEQGLGRPIISVEHHGYRIVAVGSKLHWSKNWKTFHDFLLDYIKIAIGDNWGNVELKKPLAERHPILQWYDKVCEYQRQTIIRRGEVADAPMIGAVAAYLNLAYNLYLLAHNVEIQKLLITRLKNPATFHGAYYETYVASTLIKAGFDIELEDETDSSTSHCEFTASSPRTGNKYSVEAKARHLPGVLGASSSSGVKSPTKLNVGDQLYRALQKVANHSRIVFIDVNMPDSGGPAETLDDITWAKPALEELRRREKTLTIRGEPAPPAYVFLTNFPYHHELASLDFQTAVVAEGFKIPEFKLNAQFPGIREAVNARNKHRDMFDLVTSMRQTQIPSTFDGQPPEYALREIDQPQLIIGRKYVVPDAGGREVAGELTDALVNEKERKVYGALLLDDGRSVIGTWPLTDDEIRIYRRHPDTFFGVYRKVQTSTKDPIDLFDFFHASYKDTPKERLLDFMKGSPNYEKLTKLSQAELAFTYCEGLVNHMLSRQSNG